MGELLVVLVGGGGLGGLVVGGSHWVGGWCVDGLIGLLYPYGYPSRSSWRDELGDAVYPFIVVWW